MKFILSLALIFLLIPSVSALPIQEYNITFDIQPDYSVYESVKIGFRELLEKSMLNYIVVGDVSNLKIHADTRNLNYTIEESDSGQKIRFMIPDGTERLTINFVSKDLVFVNNEIYQFFINFKPPKETETLNILVILPMGFALYRDMAFPEDGEMTTDGKRIYFSWQYENITEYIPISVKFQSSTRTQIWVYTTVIVLLLLAIIFSVLYYRKKAKIEFMRGFSSNERELIEILMKGKRVYYQNRLERELKFSRAKMTRICKKLEEKGLIERQKSGRTNKIFWKG